MNETDKDKNMLWLKQHADSIAVIAALAVSMLWMNGRFNDLEKDVAVMKAVMIMKNVMPCELANNGNDAKNGK